MSDVTTGGNVPTGEDTAAVLAMASGEKTYIGEQQPEPAPEPAAEDPSGEDAPAETDAKAEGEPPKPKKSVQERIDEVTRQKYEIAREKDREIEFWKAKALQNPAQAAQPEPQHPAQADGRPDPNQYALGAMDPQYVEDLTDWKAEQAAERIAARQAEQRKAGEALSTFQARMEKLFPDGPSEGLDAFLRLPTLPIGVAEVIAASDIGPKLAEHLGDNPAELRRLGAMNPAMQARELTRLETRLSDPPKATPKTVTEAPEPPPQARGSNGQFKVAPDTDDFAAFEKQYRIGG